MKKKWDNPDTDALFRAILLLKTPSEARRFFRDLMTETELVEFGHRWKAARMLAKGEQYTDIEKATGMSSTTVARIQKWLQGKMGGYRLMIDRTSKRK
jgi:TrpR-related protein YerC/YecD